MNAAPSQIRLKHSPQRGRAFSMTELLVVIAIIAVLAGLLLVALKGVREKAMATQTRTTMQSFASACDAYKLEHGHYPGIIPEGILAASTSNHILSGTENALLALMGGAVRGDHPNYANFMPADGWIEIVVNGTTDLGKIKVNLNLIGNGPEINGKPYAPYFTPKGDEVATINGQQPVPGLQLPDLVDAWGQPIIYLRRARPVGPLVGEDEGGPGGLAGPPQFMIGPMRPYIDSTALGELARNQNDDDATPTGSILILAANPSATLAQIIRHASFGELDEPMTGQPRGDYVLLSAGKDGIYFSVADGPGTPVENAQVDNIVDGQFGTPQVVDEYDDIRLFGGG